MQATFVLYALAVGIGSTLVLDLWIVVLGKVLGITGTSWGVVGRWLAGLARGELRYHPREERAPTGAEHTAGWTFHYLVGIGYAALYPLLWGEEFLARPQVLPFLLVGLVLSTLAGMLILSPALGGGVFASRAPDQGRKIALSLINHGVFTLGQAGFAIGLFAS